LWARSSFSRISSFLDQAEVNALRLVTIQYLRAFAASLIVFYHAMAHPMLSGLYPAAFGQVGVDIFFVVSGVIMWVTTAIDSSLNPWLFFRLRLIRIVPLYWFYTAAYVVVATVAPTQLFSAALTPRYVISSLLFFPTRHPNGDIVPVYSLGWTLNYEMFFYFLFGLCLLARAQTVRLFAISAAIGGLVIVGAVVKPESAVGLTYTDPIMLEFLAGVLIGSAFLKFGTKALPAFVGGVAILAASALFLTFLGRDMPRLVMFGLPSALCVAGALAIETAGPRREFRLGAFLGDCSYSIYLAHPFVLRPFFIVASVIFIESTKLTQILLATVAIVVGVVGGVISYQTIERPFTGRLRRYFSARKRTLANPKPAT
jgi:exopolysaccharide production protein ExoZ